MVGLDGSGGPEGLATALGSLRSAGVEHLGLAWPAEGDPAGLGGPPELNAAALEAGEAVVAGRGAGWCPAARAPSSSGSVYDARPRPLTDVGEADRGSGSALLRALPTRSPPWTSPGGGPRWPTS